MRLEIVVDAKQRVVNQISVVTGLPRRRDDRVEYDNISIRNELDDPARLRPGNRRQRQCGSAARQKCATIHYEVLPSRSLEHCRPLLGKRAALTVWPKISKGKRIETVRFAAN